VQRGHVILQGVVPTVGDAETIAKALKDVRCFKDVKLGRTSQFSEGKQKYQTEFDLKCEDKKAKPTSAEPEGTATPSGSAKTDAKPDKDKDADKPEGGR
jgi:general secretion pathway protein L